MSDDCSACQWGRAYALAACEPEQLTAYTLRYSDAVSNCTDAGPLAHSPTFGPPVLSGGAQVTLNTPPLVSTKGMLGEPGGVAQTCEELNCCAQPRPEQQPMDKRLRRRPGAKQEPLTAMHAGGGGRGEGDGGGGLGGAGEGGEGGGGAGGAGAGGGMGGGGMNEAQVPSSQVLNGLTPTSTQQEPSQQEPCPLVVLASPQKMPSGVHCNEGGEHV